MVEICKHIDIDDATIKNIIDNGTFRKIIPKETGGSITNNDVPDIVVPTVTEPINPYIKYPEQQQSGGKLRKPVKTKKYNFRLV